MGCRVINNIRVNLSGDDISDEELSIHLNAVQSLFKLKIAKVNICVDSEGVDTDYIYTYPPIKRIRGSGERPHNIKLAAERKRAKLN